MRIALKIGMLLLLTVTSCKSNKSNLTKNNNDSISDTTIVVNTDTVTYQKVQETEKEIVVNIDSVLKANINIQIDTGFFSNKFWKEVSSSIGFLRTNKFGYFFNFRCIDKSTLYTHHIVAIRVQ